jgi:hypothetical protein
MQSMDCDSNKLMVMDVASASLAQIRNDTAQRRSWRKHSAFNNDSR